MLQLILAMSMMFANASFYYCSLEDVVLNDCELVGWQFETPETYAISWADEDIRHELGPGLNVHLVDDAVILEDDHVAPLVSNSESDWTR